MKKFWSVLLAVFMLLSLTACGSGEEEGVTLSNELSYGIEDVCIVTAGAESWGQDVTGYIDAGVGAYVYLEELFGERSQTVDIQILDEAGNYYEFFEVPMNDGDAFYVKVDEEGDALLVLNDVEDVFIGELTLAESDPGDTEEPEDEPVVEDGPETTTHLMSELEGMWELMGDSAYLFFYGDMTWECYDFEGELQSSGEYEFYGEDVTLHQADGQVMSLYWDEDNDLNNDEMEYLLSYVCDFEGEDFLEFSNFVASLKSYFEENGYAINYEIGTGGLYTEAGAYVIANGGQLYETMPTTVNLDEISYNDTQDGFVEIELRSLVYLDIGDFPDFVSEVDSFDYGYSCGLFDYYTGFYLPASATYGNSARGDNAYYYEYESQGQTICVDYNFSTDWKVDDDGSRYCDRTIFLRLPAEYDGLVYGFLEGYSDFASYAADINEGEEIAVMNDAYATNAVFARIND